MNPGNRLKLIASMMKKGDTVADIGTDHAYLPIYLTKEKISPKVIATELRQGPYEKALGNIQEAGLSEFIELRLGFGLRPIIPGEVDGAVIAGMGGYTISKILKDSPIIARTLKYLILQPMNNQPYIRKEIFDLGYKIVDEDVVKEENKYYEIIVVEIGASKNVDDVDILIGPCLRKKRNLHILEYLNHRKMKLEKIVDLLHRVDTNASRSTLVDYENKLEILREVIK